MTKKYFLIGILALALVFGMTVAGCEDDSADSKEVKYEGKDIAGNIYILTVTEKADRAAYIPAEGDSYVLIIKITGQPDKKSSGTVKSVSNDGTFTFQPSVEGAGTFSIVINDDKISSVTVDDGTKYMVGTFSNIYLRAKRWTNEVGEYGEAWNADSVIKLSDFKVFNGTLSKDVTYKIQISGTVDTELKHTELELLRYMNNAYDSWAGGNIGQSGAQVEIPSGPFNCNLTIRVLKDVDLTIENQEIFLGVSNRLWKKKADGSIEYNYAAPIPEEIPNWAIMATINNFKIVSISIKE